MSQTNMLTGAVTIYSVGALRSQFETWIADLPSGPSGAALNDSPLAVDAHGVDGIDAAGLQLLVSLSKSLAARRRPLQLVNPSSLLVGACDALALTWLLAPVISGTPV